VAATSDPERRGDVVSHAVHPVEVAADSVLLSSYWKRPGAPKGAHLNSLVATWSEPVLFDTGVRADADAWVEAVSSVVGPDDLRWIVITHEDADHVGNLELALEVFPQAIVVASWMIVERLMGSVEIDPRRMRWVVSGESLEVGDRTLVFERPPLLDSPTTRAVLEPTSGLYWGGDFGAAPSPDPWVFASDAPEDDLAASFLQAQRWGSPYLEMVDHAKYHRAIDRFESLGITTWASAHGPVYRGDEVRQMIGLLHQVPDEVAGPQPGQIALDALVASVVDR
jgi:flavorubredoxin